MPLPLPPSSKHPQKFPENEGVIRATWVAQFCPSGRCECELSAGSDPVGPHGQTSCPWGAGNDFGLDPAGENPLSWTLYDSVLLCVCYTFPAPPPPQPSQASFLFSHVFPLPWTHFCQPEEGTAAQFLFASLLAEHLPSPSCLPLLPCFSFLLLQEVLQEPL